MKLPSHAGSERIERNIQARDAGADLLRNASKERGEMPAGCHSVDRRPGPGQNLKNGFAEGTLCYLCATTRECLAFSRGFVPEEKPHAKTQRREEKT
jgi:hypothetical protein